jgi:tetratricopeptide (TPR) repeat protein
VADGTEPRPSISVAMFGRQQMNVDIERLRVKCSLKSIKIRKEDNAIALDEYIEERLREFPPCSTALKLEVKEMIVKKADGMFLWAKLAFDMLRPFENRVSESQIRDTLDRVHEGIDNMIGQLLKTICSALSSKQQREEMIFIMSWLSVSSRSLSLHEIANMLSHVYYNGDDLPVAEFDFLVSEFEERLRKDCSSLVNVDRDDHMSTSALRESSPGHDHIPQATYVSFSHASIKDYIKDLVLSSSAKSDVDGSLLLEILEPADALNTVLRVCLCSLRTGNTDERCDALKSIQPYAIDSVLHLLEQTAGTAYESTDPRRVHMISLLVSTFTEKAHLREWCLSTPSEFFDKNCYSIIHKWLNQWSEGIVTILPELTRQTVQLWINVPKCILISAAELMWEEAKRNLSYPPFATVDALDRMMAFEYLVEPIDNEVSHTNRGIFFMHSSSLDDAEEKFKAALELNPDYFEARSCLAEVFRCQNRFQEAIALELHTLNILDAQRTPPASAVERRAHCYESMANSYRCLDDQEKSLTHLEKAADTGSISIDAASSYFRMASKGPEPLQWSRIIRILEGWELCSSKEYPDRLTEFIHQNRWPSQSPDNIFFILTRSAMSTVPNTDPLGWLEAKYTAAMRYAKTHISALGLKACMIFLYRMTRSHLHPVKNYIEIAAELCANNRNGRLLGLEICKPLVVQEYCQMQIRNSLLEDTSLPAIEQRIDKIKGLCLSGVVHSDPKSKLIYRERSELCLAILLRKCGRKREALERLQPLIHECKRLVFGSDEDCYIIGLRSLTEILFIQGESDLARQFLALVHSHSMWVCTNCQEFCQRVRDVEICEYCFARFCSECMHMAHETDIPNGCCIKGHSLQHMSARRPRRIERIVINKRRVGVKEAVKLTVQKLTHDPAA